MYDLAKAKALIIKWEGCKLEAYQDSVGVWTIGYGSTYINGRPVNRQDVCAKADAESFLDESIKDISHIIKRMLKVSVSSNEFNALVSFAYNVGVGNLRRSTLLKYINDGVPAPICAQEFHKWNRAGGKILAGLIARRKDEADLFLLNDEVLIG